MSYINDKHTYTNPSAYDARKKTALEAYLHSQWSALIEQYAADYITDKTTVCDFGCGTLAHAKFMQHAHQVYAIDSNNEMVTHGLSVQKEYTTNVTPLIKSALATSLPHATCDVVWSIGLTEYVDLYKLLEEMSRVSKPTGILLLQFPNAYHPLHIFIRILRAITGGTTKRYRTLHEVIRVASAHGWNVVHVESVGFYIPVPSSMVNFFTPLWKRIDVFMRPLRFFLPIGNNVWCVLEKSTSV